jgi:hypothetical protein
MGLKVTEIFGGVSDVEPSGPEIRLGKGIRDYVIHRADFPDTIFDYEPIEPYSTKVKSAAEIMWIYGIMVHSMPMPDADNAHRYVYRAFIPDRFDQREDGSAARIEISALVWVDADTWPLAIVRAALMQEKMRKEKRPKAEERHG